MRHPACDRLFPVVIIVEKKRKAREDLIDKEFGAEPGERGMAPSPLNKEGEEDGKIRETALAK